MSITSGSTAATSGLVFSIDTANRKSSLRKTQQNNILVDPNTWTTGTGSFTGYGANGSASEQNRVAITDDPWGRNSIVWATTPDDVSNADGGWNTSSYTIDQNKLYRYSVWVRRHTAGTGGTFYFGMNPAPIRNDNSAAQSNPYFSTPSQASLTLNQWYLVVAHCFPHLYRGGRHPDSGWYENGNKISDKSYGNVGASDVRWNPGTTSALHRAYHYYTTNTSSGLQFAYPRLDLCDGNEPSIDELLNTGESATRNLVDLTTLANLVNSPLGFDYNNNGSLVFNGSNNYLTIPSFTKPTTQITCEAWIYPTKPTLSGTIRGGAISATNSMYLGIIDSVDGGQTHAMHWANQTSVNRIYNWNGNVPNNAWSHLVGTYDGTTMRAYLNGVQIYSAAQTGTIPNATYVIGTYGNGLQDGVHNFNGKIPVSRIYNRALSAGEVAQNFQALRGRFGI